MASAVGPLDIRNPVILASCPLGDSPEGLRAAYGHGAGAVVTKSITMEPREGGPEPYIAEIVGGWHMNWAGLRNPGAEAFARMLGRPDYPVIVSLAGSMPHEFGEMVGMFDGVAGFELNVSCPNVAGMGDHVGGDPALTAQAVRAAKRATDLPVFVKVGYQMYRAVGAAVDAGADGITAINTIPGVHVGADPPTIHRGGLSGPPLLPIGLGVVRDIVRGCGVPVMGCGGVATWRDAAGYMAMGASAVQVGTAAMRDPSVLGRIAAGLAAGRSGAEKGHRVPMR